MQNEYKLNKEIKIQSNVNYKSAASPIFSTDCVTESTESVWVKKVSVSVPLPQASAFETPQRTMAQNISNIFI